MTTATLRLGHAQAAQTYIHTGINNHDARELVAGLYTGNSVLINYHETIKLCRWFYTFDPIAGTVIDRMSDMSITTLRNRRKSKKNSNEVDDTVMAYYDVLVERLRPLLKLIALEYMVHGMAVPDYTFGKIRGNLLSEKLGRKRYILPEKIWIRNPENLELRRTPVGMERLVYIKIPREDIEFIQNKGKRSDGTHDLQGYRNLLDEFPEYVRAIQQGDTKFLLEDARPILRKITSYSDYPAPFLVNALSALQHKAYLKAMDRSIASRAIEAIRHIKVGSDTFPADDSDIKATREEVTQNSSAGERVFNLFTNHTIDIEWIFPPLDALLNEAKYSEPNADIFLALGFPRILTVGETVRSNSSDSKIAALGPKSTLDDLRDSIIFWLRTLYQELAELNGFTRIPDPYFSPIATSDYTALVQFAIQALKAGAISKDTVAQLYGTDYETEAAQIETEQSRGVLSPEEIQKEREYEQEKELNEQPPVIIQESQDDESGQE